MKIFGNVVSVIPAEHDALEIARQDWGAGTTIKVGMGW